MKTVVGQQEFTDWIRLVEWLDQRPGMCAFTKAFPADLHYLFRKPAVHRKELNLISWLRGRGWHLHEDVAMRLQEIKAAQMWATQSPESPMINDLNIVVSQQEFEDWKALVHWLDEQRYNASYRLPGHLSYLQDTPVAYRKELKLTFWSSGYGWRLRKGSAERLKEIEAAQPWSLLPSIQTEEGN